MKTMNISDHFRRAPSAYLPGPRLVRYTSHLEDPFSNHYTKTKTNLDFIHSFLESNYRNINEKHNGQTILHWAVEQRNISLIKDLLDYREELGLDVNSLTTESLRGPAQSALDLVEKSSFSLSINGQKIISLLEDAGCISNNVNLFHNLFHIINEESDIECA
jgi:ankyrin repeat protein